MGFAIKAAEKIQLPASLLLSHDLMPWGALGLFLLMKET
jgi:hypothetical protein